MHLAAVAALGAVQDVARFVFLGVAQVVLQLAIAQPVVGNQLALVHLLVVGVASLGRILQPQRDLLLLGGNLLFGHGRGVEAISRQVDGCGVDGPGGLAVGQLGIVGGREGRLDASGILFVCLQQSPFGLSRRSWRRMLSLLAR